MKNTAIILAAGKGTRMGGDIPKQFLLLEGEPLVCRSLRTFDESPEIDEIILVTDGEHIGYCREEIVKKYRFGKAGKIIAGGRERYDSVLAGLNACTDCGCVFIHDSARPYVTEDIIRRAAECAEKYGACAVGMPSKDTVKIADAEGFVESTPPRSRVWTIQTPQVFQYGLLMKAYAAVREKGMEGITDDAMVVERSGLARVRLVEGSYGNIKITTPEDLRR